ncbi:MAG: hypothetical protein ABIW76_14460 [Fibrobacteria bacterium]
MHSIAIRRTWYGAILALIFLGIGMAEAAPSRQGRANEAPWRTLEWLTSKATVLTTAGIAWVIDKLDETVQTTADYVAWGTGAGTAVVGNTTLFTEAAEARVVATRTQPAADTIQWVGSLTSASAQTITNAGNFTASTAGTMIVKGDFTGIALAIGDIIQFTITLQQT